MSLISSLRILIVFAESIPTVKGVGCDNLLQQDRTNKTEKGQDTASHGRVKRRKRNGEKDKRKKRDLKEMREI